MHLYLNPHVQPAPGTRAKILEPIVDARIIARVEDAGSVMDLITRKRGSDLRTKPIDEEKWMFTARLPWAEVVTDFHDQLKNATAGYGSLDTREADPPFAEAKLSKVEFMLNGELVDPLSFVCHKDVAHNQAKAVCEKVRGHLFIKQGRPFRITKFASPFRAAARSTTSSTIRDRYPGKSRW